MKAALLAALAAAILGCGSTGDDRVSSGTSTGTLTGAGGGSAEASSSSSGGGHAASTASSAASSGVGGGCVVAAPSGPLEAATTTGLLHGKQDGATVAFLGVPFAAPPVGDLRFRAPEPPACWEGVRAATDYGSACVQDMPQGGKLGDEDCLFLNVWTPKAGGGSRPVLFFVYGGAYLFGSGSQDLLFDGTGNLYSGQTLADERDAVVVTSNYRLAELGFLAHPSLAKEDPDGSSGNYGLLDQIAALRWVHDNIASFGGDPARVLLFGESAGGLSTCLLTSSPLAKGLFSSALVESGGCIVATKASRFDQGASIADALGCSAAPDVPACLRSKPADDFRVSPPSGTSLFVFNDIQRAWEMPYGPNLDGHVFTETPMASLRQGHGSKVPLAVGSNGTEFDLFIPPGTINTCVDYWAAIAALFPGISDDVIAHYSCFDYLLPRYAAIDVGTDFMFTCPARRIARAALQGGAPAVYRYYDPHTYTNSPLSAFRSFHASELPFVFRTFDVLGYAPTAGDVAMSKAIAGYWTGLAASGDPNANAAFPWPKYVAAQDPALVLDDQLSVKSAIAEARCDFWDTIAAE